MVMRLEQMAFCTQAVGERVAAAASATARRRKRENATLISDIGGSGRGRYRARLRMPEFRFRRERPGEASRNLGGGSPCEGSQGGILSPSGRWGHALLLVLIPVIGPQGDIRYSAYFLPQIRLRRIYWAGGFEPLGVLFFLRKMFFLREQALY